MSSAKIKNSFTKWGIHPHCNEAPEGSKLNAATQTQSTQSFETNRLRENSVLVALGAQRQIIYKGCDDSVLCSYRFEALLFSKREKWIEFVFEAELMPYGSRTEASINLTKDATSIIPPMIKIKKEFIEESVRCNLVGDPSSFCIKTQDNFSIESDQEDEIGLGLGEDLLLNPPIKIEVDDLRDQGKEIIHKELLLDPLAQLDVDAELLLSSLLDNSVKRAKPELDPPPDLVSKDSLLVKEEWDDEKYSYPPSSSEANLERELATGSSTNDELRRTRKEKFHPLLKECFVRVERLPRELAARYEANKAFKFAEKIKEQIKFFSESTRKLSDDTSPSSKRIRMTPELTDNVNLEPESQSVNAICEDNIESVHKLKSIYCTMCHMTFSTKASLNMHIFAVHEMSELFKCNSCSYVCSEKETLSKHLKFVHCDFAAGSMDNFTNHMKSVVHGKIKPFTCLECNRTCSLKGNLGSHMNSFKCLECNHACSLKGNLNCDMKSVHEKITPFKCMKCNYSSIKQSYLLRHTNSAHKKSKSFKCLECNNLFSQKDHLDSHVKSVHEKRKPFKCLECNGTFTKKYHLFHHVNSVHKKIKPFKCLECNYSFSKKHTLTLHMNSVHLKIKPFKCLECNRSFSLKKDFVRHVNSIHKKIKPFKCAVCDGDFSHKSSLNLHILKVHKKLKPFNCSKCNFACYLKSNLSVHMNGVHEKIKPFRCLECNYLCSHKSSLIIHIRAVHEKLKPFKCLECNRSFGLKSTLIMHMKSIHEK